MDGQRPHRESGGICPTGPLRVTTEGLAVAHGVDKCLMAPHLGPVWLAPSSLAPQLLLPVLRSLPLVRPLVTPHLSSDVPSLGQEPLICSPITLFFKPWRSLQ